ncbi:MAG TPA: hypothetical protein VN025_08515 [Candidatus Dormibacteraeota bacterium]|jgi:hypothetical protein|nr:hypothetical protein [Candidatus Dormibacteraeota bacterium]
MNRVRISAAFFFFSLSIFSTRQISAQQKPLTRAFTSGAEEHYQVSVTVRVETHGVSTEKIGEKTYATFYTHEAAGQLSWRAVRQISKLNPGGTAAIVETLDHFQVNCGGDPGSKAFDAILQKSVQDTCATWQNSSEMKYEEENSGLIHGLPEPVGQLTGSDSTLLLFWVRRAFRPSVILPKTPIHFGERSEHKILNPSGGEGSITGQETSEWLEASVDAPAATLHVSQDLNWIDPPLKSSVSNVSGKPSMRQFFYADSLNTVSLLDGSLVKASRAATRETKQLLEPVPSLPDVPEFGSKLTISVTMQRLP